MTVFPGPAGILDPKIIAAAVAKAQSEADQIPALLTKSSKPKWPTREDRRKPALELLGAYREGGVEWVSVGAIGRALFELGVIPSPDARAVGDLLGHHGGGLGLDKRKIQGKVYYSTDVGEQA